MEETYQELKTQTGRKKIEKASTDPNSASMRGALLQFKWKHTFPLIYHVAEACGAIEKVDFRMFEIFVALVNGVLVPQGFPELMARDIDKLKDLCLGRMVERITGRLAQDEDLKDLSLFGMIRFCQMEGGAISMKDILTAKNMAKPANATTKMDHLLRIALKRNVQMTNGDPIEAIKDDTGQYYVSKCKKREAAKELTDTVKRMGLDCNEDMMRSALVKQEQSAHAGSANIVYKNTADNRDVLHIKCELVNNIGVLTDTEAQVLMFLKGMKDNAQFSHEDYDESHYLFAQNVRRGIQGPLEIQNSSLDDILRDLKGALDDQQRSTALYWLKQMPAEDGGKIVDVSEDVEHPFNRINVVDTQVPRSVPCDPEGHHSGKFKTRLVAPGTLKVNKLALDSFNGLAETSNLISSSELKFADMLMAISGEAQPGKRIFYGVSSIIDEDTSAAITHVIQEWNGSVTIKNPRRREGASVIDHSKLMKADDILDETKTRIVFTKHSNLWNRIRDSACFANTGLSYEEAADAFKEEFF